MQGESSNLETLIFVVTTTIGTFLIRWICRDKIPNSKPESSPFGLAKKR